MVRLKTNTGSCYLQSNASRIEIPFRIVNWHARIGGKNPIVPVLSKSEKFRRMSMYYLWYTFLPNGPYSRPTFSIFRSVPSGLKGLDRGHIQILIIEKMLPQERGKGGNYLMLLLSSSPAQLEGSGERRLGNAIWKL